MFNVCYKSGNIEKGRQNLINAILLNPQILDKVFFKDISLLDPNFISDVKDELIGFIENDLNQKNPMIQARYGRILYSLGEYDKAERVLEFVVSALPNLFLPLYYLSQIYIKKNDIANADKILKKLLVLMSDKFMIKKTDNYDVALLSDEIGRVLRDEQNIYSEYINKFSSWYASEVFL